MLFNDENNSSSTIYSVETRFELAYEYFLSSPTVHAYVQTYTVHIDTHTHLTNTHILLCVCASLRGRCKFPFLFLINAAFAVVQNKETCVRCRAVPRGEKASLCEEARCIFINLVSTGLTQSLFGIFQSIKHGNKIRRRVVLAFFVKFFTQGHFSTSVHVEAVSRSFFLSVFPSF